VEILIAPFLLTSSLALAFWIRDSFSWMPYYAFGGFVLLAIFFGLVAYSEAKSVVPITVGSSHTREISPNLALSSGWLVVWRGLSGTHPILENARSPLYLSRTLYWSGSICLGLLTLIYAAPTIALHTLGEPQSDWGYIDAKIPFNPLNPHLVTTTFAGTFLFTLKTIRDEADRKWRHANDLISKYLTSNAVSNAPTDFLAIVRTENLYKAMQVRHICRTLLAFDLWAKPQFAGFFFNALLNSPYLEEDWQIACNRIDCGGFTKEEALHVFAFTPSHTQQDRVTRAAARLESEARLEATRREQDDRSGAV
jgi:hypothetical protein